MTRRWIGIVLGAGIAALEHGDAAVNLPFILVSLLTGAAFAAVGAILLPVRPANGLGLLLYTTGTALVLEFSLREFAFRGLRVAPGSLPWPDVLGWTAMASDPVFFRCR